jgi:hypothetical protein
MLDLAGWIVRTLRRLPAALDRPAPDRPALDRPAPDQKPEPVCGAAPVAPSASSAPCDCHRPASLPRHRSPYAAEAAAEAAADRWGAGRRYPPPGPRRYALARWHQPEVAGRPAPPARGTDAALRLTRGRRRAELWLATAGVDAGPRVPHGAAEPVQTGAGR